MMMKFFTSLKTTLWISGLAIGVFLAGSVVIPRNLDVFSEINDLPLFTWISRNTMYRGEISWIFLLLVLMTLLAVNMIICGIDSIRRSLRLRGFLELVSPQILHLGVLFVLLGHLVSAGSGYREDVVLDLHQAKKVRGTEIRIDRVEFVRLPEEDSTRPRVVFAADGNSFLIEPAQPAFYQGVEYFVKSAQQGRNQVLVGLVYDPGVLFEIIGALVFVLGAGGIFSVQLSRTV